MWSVPTRPGYPVTVTELSGYLETDLTFSRGETPAFRLAFTGVDAAEIATWDITAPIRRDPRAEPVGAFDVTVDGTDVTFSLPADVSEALPEHTSYTVRLATDPDVVRVPMGGRLLLRTTPCP